jgi:hypothetical protein
MSVLKLDAAHHGIRGERPRADDADAPRCGCPALPIHACQRSERQSGLVSPVVVCFASDHCVLTGEVSSVGAGTVAQIIRTSLPATNKHQSATAR